MTFAEWEKRGHEVGNAEAATVVMGWVKVKELGYEWHTPDGKFRAYAGQWSPCTDRNATDLVLAEVEKKGLRTGLDFDHLLIEYMTETRCDTVLSYMRASPSLLTWAAVEACRGGG